MDGLIFSSGSLCTDAPKNTSGIYGIQNHSTGMWYVGQAGVGKRTKGVRGRAQAYLLLRCKKQRAIYHSIKMHGLLSHSCYLLEECKDKDLNAREGYWIVKMKSLAPHGYNMRGGDMCGYKKSKKLSTKMRYAVADTDLETR